MHRSRIQGKSLRSTIFFLVLALASVGTTNALADQKSSKLTSINMVQEWPVADAFWIPWIVGQNKGFYKEAGIDLKIIAPPTVAATMQYLGTGKADLAFTTTMDVVFARAAGVPVVSIGRYGQGNNWGLISSTAKPLDFTKIKGLKIGTYNDAWSNAQLGIMLQSQGLKLKDVQLVSATDDTVPLLINGKVDAITGITNAEGTELNSLKKPYGIVLAKDHGVPNSPIFVLAANNKWLSANPDLAKRWMAATIKGMQYAIANPKEAVSIFLKAYPKAESLDYATKQWADTMAILGSSITSKSLVASDADWSSLLQAVKTYKIANKVEAPANYYTNKLLSQ
jgi:putative hydroxymethylpyrimidine transport system substrate-binding protein